MNLISPENYPQDVENAERFLLGRAEEVTDALQAQDDCATRKRWSSSRRPWCETRSASLSRVLHQQGVEDNSGVTTKDADILAVQVEGGRACVNLAMVRGGRHLGDRPYFPAHVDDASQWAAEADAEPTAAPSAEVQVLEAFIAQHYLDGSVPPLLVLSHAVDRDADRHPVAGTAA